MPPAARSRPRRTPDRPFRGERDEVTVGLLLIHLQHVGTMGDVLETTAGSSPLRSEIVIRDGVSRIVADLLPGVRLLEMVKNPY